MGKDFLKWGRNNCDEQGTSLKGSGWGVRRVERCMPKGGRQAAEEMTQASPTQPPQYPGSCLLPQRASLPPGTFPLTLTVGIEVWESLSRTRALGGDVV